MVRRKSRLRSISRAEVLAEAVGLLRSYRTDTLLSLIPILSAFSARQRLQVTPAMVRRTALRFGAVERFGELRGSPVTRGWTDDKVAERVCEELRKSHPAARCSIRSVRRWRDAWRHRGPAGLADKYVCDPSPRMPTPHRLKRRRPGRRRRSVT